MRFNGPSAVVPEAEMVRRGRKTTLDAGNGNQMEVGTLLRERRTKQAGAQLVAKKAARRALRMQKVDALVGELGQDPSREGMSTCCVFALIIYLPSESFIHSFSESYSLCIHQVCLITAAFVALFNHFYLYQLY